MNLSELFRLFLSLSLSGSILALGLLFIKFIFKQKIRANWHYYLWFVLIIRLLVPFSPPSSLSIFNLLPYPSSTTNLNQMLTAPSSITADATIPDSLTKTPLNDDLQTSTNALSASVNTKINVFNLAIMWLSGIGLILSYVCLINGRLWLKIKKQPPCKAKDIEEILEESKMLLKIQSKVSLVYDIELTSPALFGWRKPKIIISQQIIDKLSHEELKYVFLHELSHLKRRDLLVNTLITLIQIVYWFNPIIWYSLHQMKLDCEIACDATALAIVKPEEHKNYAQTIIELMQLLSEPRWVPGTMGFVNKFNARRIIMISSFKQTTMKWTIAALALTLVVGCSSLTPPLSSTEGTKNQSDVPTTTSQQNSSAGGAPAQSSQTLLLTMMQLAQQGKVLNSNFPVKTTVIEDIEKVLGPADSTDYVAAAKGRYATFSSHKLAFGINKGEQIFEARSFDSRLAGISFDKVKTAFGTPAYDTKYNGQEIVGYTAGPEFKIEMVFPQPTADNPNPVMDHYSVLYPQGTVNSMADDPGRQW
ncbi:M56 family metallopeptidase [Desulfosporosinus sp. SB140]|uniref:M56 family metallopeptidase n=1 Tax=Desulfosporosinus paludis TaxID=3115649 RepID=UPI00388F6249